MERPLGLTSSKVVAVHLNYRSRAEERGRVPATPSYFLKPPSSLASDGAPLVRPLGCVLMAYEGEIAIVIGREVRRASLDEAAGAIGFVAAANDVGVYDLRWPDGGSNLRSKGQDGYTPIGPRLAPASELDLPNLTVRTLLNGQLVQEGCTSDLIFSFDVLVADLSRFMTLEPGDVILTGTPANSRPMEPGDVVEVEVEGVGRITNTVVADANPIEAIGAMPRVRPEDRAAALGAAAPRPVAVAPETLSLLGKVATATLTTQLQRRGIRNAFMAGLRPTRPGRRMVGFAHTVRYVPVREDVVESRAGAENAQRTAVESIAAGEVLVIEARNLEGAGTIGDILALRAWRRGAAGIVTDGAVRDGAAIAELDIPTYHRGVHGSVLSRLHFPLETNVPVACGEVLVMPGDVIVGDDDGVVVVPAALADGVAAAAHEQELEEQFALERVGAGESARGLFPLSDVRRAEFEEWKSSAGIESLSRASAPGSTRRL